MSRQSLTVPYFRHRQPWLVGLVTLALHGVALILVLRALPAPKPPRTDVIAVRFINAAEPREAAVRPVEPPPPTPRDTSPPVAVKQIVRRDVAAPLAVPAKPVKTVTPAPEQKPTVPDSPPPKDTPPEPALVPPSVPPRFDAAYLNNPAPAYPALSRRDGERGTVLLRVEVSAEGAAVAVTLAKSSGFDRLDEAARKAVTSWRFVPSRRGSEAVAGSVLVPIIFALTGVNPEE